MTKPTRQQRRRAMRKAVKAGDHEEVAALWRAHFDAIAKDTMKDLADRMFVRPPDAVTGATP